MRILVLLVLVVWLLLGVLTVGMLNIAKLLVRSAAQRTTDAPRTTARVDDEASVRFVPSVRTVIAASATVSHRSG